MTNLDNPLKGVPSEEEIARLPRLASVAFAARCAWRVLPLFSSAWPNASVEHVEAIAYAVRLAVRKSSSPNSSWLQHAAHLAADDAREATMAAGTIRTARAAGAAAAFAARSHELDIVNAAEAAADAARYYAADVSKSVDKIEIQELIRHDYELLCEAAGREKWSDSTLVPPEIFGPMWPEGKPDGWPPESSPIVEPVIKLTLAVPKGLSETQSQEFNRRVADLLAEMSRKNAAMGGSGLRIVDHQSLEPAVIVDNSPEYCSPDGEAVLS